MAHPGGKRLRRSLDLMERQALLMRAAESLSGDIARALHDQAEACRRAQHVLANGACPGCGQIFEAAS